MKTIEQIARELGDDWDTTLPEDKVFIENVAKAYLSAWLEQQSQEPVAYMAPSGTCVTAEDVSYTPNWTDYYTTPLVRQADAAAVIAAKVRFDRNMEGYEESPIERLRYFCSLSMNARDWLDVEPFFDALTTPTAVPSDMRLVPKEPTAEWRERLEELGYSHRTVIRDVLRAAPAQGEQK